MVRATLASFPASPTMFNRRAISMWPLLVKGELVMPCMTVLSQGCRTISRCSAVPREAYTCTEGLAVQASVVWVGAKVGQALG